MASIYDVAKKANVSASTVSRIINGERNVAPATAAAVEKAIAAVGYVKRAVRPGPKPLSRTGVKTGMIDFLSLGSFSPAEMFSFPSFFRLLNGVMRTVEGEGMDLVLSHCPQGKVIPPVLARRRADGVLLFGNPSLYPKISKVLERIPVVWCFVREPVDDFEASYVLYDNQPVGRIATDYLLERNHRQLAFVNVEQNHHAIEMRKQVFLGTLEERGLTAVSLECTSEPPHAAVTVRAEAIIDQLLAMESRPTGVFCATDDLMLSLFNGLRRRGIEPGRDIELIGCNNDASQMQQMHPRPATIDLKLDQVGQKAVELLHQKMSESSENHGGSSWVEPSLVPAELFE